MLQTLYFVHEPEAACRERLAADGFDARRALELSSYLAQSTDLEPEFAAIADACQTRGLTFEPVALDDAPAVLGKATPEASLVWTVTDGIAYYRGSAAPALAQLYGLPKIGSDFSLFALCQDKFRAGAVMRALGLPIPQAGLARGNALLIAPPESDAGYFVKPNRLGSKIGIYPDSHGRTVEEALAVAARIRNAYRDDAVIQPYVPGRNVRASFLGLDPNAGIERLGVFLVDSGGDFQTMEDSLALYGETGQEALETGAYAEPQLVRLSDSQPEADREIRTIAQRLMDVLGLRDVFSLDFRVEDGGRVHLIEFEVCPGLPCFDFRAYAGAEWGLSLVEAIAETASRRFRQT